MSDRPITGSELRERINALYQKYQVSEDDALQLEAWVVMLNATQSSMPAEPSSVHREAAREWRERKTRYGTAERENFWDDARVEAYAASREAELVAALRQAAKDLRKAQFNDPRDHYAAARKIEALLSRYPETQ